MKKHMTLEQMFDAYDGNKETINVFQRGCIVEDEMSGYMQMPVYKIERYLEGIAVYIGTEREKDNYDLTPTKENMKSILDEAFESWYDSRRDEIVKEIIHSGDYDDEIIERILCDTEYSSIDEMTEKIDELEDQIETMMSALDEIYRTAREFV